MNYVLYGEESYLIKKELNRIIETSVTFEKEMNTAVFDGSKTNMEEIIADAQTIPFFSDFKVVVVNQANFLSASSDSDYSIEALEHYLDSPNSSTILVMICPFPKLDQRKKIVKRLQKEARCLQFSVFNDFERAQFVLNQSKLLGVTLSKDALNEFYYRIAYSAERIISELNKLSLYSKRIEKADVISLIERPLDDNVFDIFKAILSHDFKRAYQYWKDFDSLNIDPIALIAMLASQYRFLHQVKILQVSGLSKMEISKKLGAHPYRVEMTLQSSSSISEQEIGSALNDLAQLDQDIKAGKVDKKFGFEMFLIKRGN